MRKAQAMKIIQEYWLTCKPSEFVTQFEKEKGKLKNIKDSYTIEIKTFEQPYNWTKVENPAKWKYYYVLNANWKVYLQYHYPYKPWMEPLTDENINEAIEEHKNKLAEEEIYEKAVEETIEHFLE